MSTVRVERGRAPAQQGHDVGSNHNPQWCAFSAEIPTASNTLQAGSTCYNRCSNAAEHQTALTPVRVVKCPDHPTSRSRHLSHSSTGAGAVVPSNKSPNTCVAPQRQHLLQLKSALQLTRLQRIALARAARCTSVSSPPQLRHERPSQSPHQLLPTSIQDLHDMKGDSANCALTVLLLHDVLSSADRAVCYAETAAAELESCAAQGIPPTPGVSLVTELAVSKANATLALGKLLLRRHALISALHATFQRGNLLQPTASPLDLQPPAKRGAVMPARVSGLEAASTAACDALLAGRAVLNPDTKRRKLRHQEAQDRCRTPSDGGTSDSFSDSSSSRSGGGGGSSALSGESFDSGGSRCSREEDSSLSDEGASLI